MLRFLLTSILAVCIPLAGVAAQHEPALPPPPTEPDVITDTPVAIDEVYAIPEPEMAPLVGAALEGDGAAALRLALHFGSGINTNKVKSRFWLIIAAENNNDVAQYNLWFYDQGSPDEALRTRANFWLRRAASNGNEYADRELKKIEK